MDHEATRSTLRSPQPRLAPTHAAAASVMCTARNDQSVQDQVEIHVDTTPPQSESASIKKPASMTRLHRLWKSREPQLQNENTLNEQAVSNEDMHTQSQLPTVQAHRPAPDAGQISTSRQRAPPEFRMSDWFMVPPQHNDTTTFELASPPSPGPYRLFTDTQASPSPMARNGPATAISAELRAQLSRTYVDPTDEPQALPPITGHYLSMLSAPVSLKEPQSVGSTPSQCKPGPLKQDSPIVEAPTQPREPGLQQHADELAQLSCKLSPQLVKTTSVYDRTLAHVRVKPDVGKAIQSLGAQLERQDADGIRKPTRVEVAEELAERCWLADTTWMPMSEMTRWLGGTEPLQVQTRAAFMERLDVAGMNVLDALRALCKKLYMQAETSQIDNLLQSLSSHYVLCNPVNTLGTASAVHSALFSLFLLNTDLHLAEIPQRMTQTQFVSNTITALHQDQSSEEWQPGQEAQVRDDLREWYASVLAEKLAVPDTFEEQHRLVTVKRVLSLNRNPSTKRASRALSQRRASHRWMDMSRQHSLHGDTQCIQFSRAFDATWNRIGTLRAVMSHMVIHDPNRHWQGWRALADYRVQFDKDSLLFHVLESPCVTLPATFFRASLLQAYAELASATNEPSLSLTLGDGSIHLLAASARTVEVWCRACNTVAARFSSVPLYGVNTNTEYGWLHVETAASDATTRVPVTRNTPRRHWLLRPRTWMGRVSLRSLRPATAEWIPPPNPMVRSPHSLMEQQTKIQEYLVYLQAQLQHHLKVHDPMLKYWSEDSRGRARALANWHRRQRFLQAQLVQYAQYRDHLNASEVRALAHQILIT